MKEVNQGDVVRLMAAVTCGEYQISGLEGQENVEKLCVTFHALTQEYAIDPELIAYFDKAVEEKRIKTENNEPPNSIADCYPDPRVISKLLCAVASLNMEDTEFGEQIQWSLQYLVDFYRPILPSLEREDTCFGVVL